MTDLSPLYHIHFIQYLSGPTQKGNDVADYQRKSYIKQGLKKSLKKKELRKIRSIERLQQKQLRNQDQIIQFTKETYKTPSAITFQSYQRCQGFEHRFDISS